MKHAVLTIAGSDSSGGAGIQADLKAMSANGVFGLSVITSITAQNTLGVSDVFHLPASIIEAQLTALFSDIPVDAVKTGMLATTAIVTTVSRILKQHNPAHLIVDPVMVAKGGQSLLEPQAISTMKTELIPQATLLTPNIHEAEILAEKPIRTLADARTAAKIIYQLGCRHILIKGGHLGEQPGTDLLYDGKFFRMYKGEYIETDHTHGTGCTLASAIAAQIAKGKAIQEAVEVAKTYTTEAIRHGFPLGRGHGPTDHFYFLES
ncbi:MAG: bifunctional hydroxymethylpyrimidine kinase/phosphomethylpyrimidine kinase [Desulfobulbia bacterium]